MQINFIMKNYYLLLIFSLLCFGCYAQNNKLNKIEKPMNLAFIKNEKFKYSIILMSCDTCVPISNIGYRVKVQLSKKEEETVRKITFDTWKELLNNHNSDWAANLILYSIYDKDAFLLSKNDKRDLWVKYLKKEDFLFWDKIFHN